MFTTKDIECRTIYVINCLESRDLRVQSGELLLTEGDGGKTLTKLPFQKILALFVVGHIRITTPLIDKCKRYNVALIVVKPTLRPVFFWSSSAEANYLLRKKQYEFDKNNITIAKVIVQNKLYNQWCNLSKIRKHTPLIDDAKLRLSAMIDAIAQVDKYEQLMGMEGRAAKNYFEAYFEQDSWKGRFPRTKRDPLNATLDIGYTVLFNFVECFVLMYGFDTYAGIYHRLWFKRKSLICDLMEPFRPLIDSTIRTAIHRKQFVVKDFNLSGGEFILKPERRGEYLKQFFDCLIPHKMDVFKYVQSYYRAFMQDKSQKEYPQFILR